MTIDVVRAGGGRLRVGPWRDSDHVAYVAPVPGAPAGAATVRRACAVLADRGFDRAVTAALAPAEMHGFVAAGFEVREHLHLLWRELPGADLPAIVDGVTLRRERRADGVTLRRGRRADHAAVLAVDTRSFPSFWRLDRGGLDEALHATSSARFRVATSSGGGGASPLAVVGYAVSGRSGRQGFVQRLAVDAAHRRAGLGGALIVDGLRWLRRWGATSVVVNTQVGNDAAIGLYESLGFRRQAGGLVVLEAHL